MKQKLSDNSTTSVFLPFCLFRVVICRVEFMLVIGFIALWW